MHLTSATLTRCARAMIAKIASGSPTDADRAAMDVAIALRGIDVRAHLLDMLVKLPTRPINRVAELTPFAWKTARTVP